MAEKFALNIPVLSKNFAFGVQIFSPIFETKKGYFCSKISIYENPVNPKPDKCYSTWLKPEKKFQTRHDMNQKNANPSKPTYFTFTQGGRNWGGLPFFLEFSVKILKLGKI